MTRVAEFSIEFTRFLDASGQLVAPLPEGAGDVDSLVETYRLMVLARTFDAKAIALQRTGQLGTYASCLGQEATGAAVGLAMRAEDVLVPSYPLRPSSFAANPGWWSPPAATAPPPRATSTSPSISPESGTCRWCSW
jgi:hypothetical protein